MNTKFPAVASLDARPPRERACAENLPQIDAENAPTGRNKRNPMRGAARAWGTPRASNAPERRNCPERTRSRGAPFPRGSCAFQARVLFETRPQAAFRRMGLFLFRIPCGFVRGKAWRRRRPRLCCGARERLARAESFLPQMSRMNTDESPDGAELPSVGCQPYGNGNENDARCKCAIAGTRGRGKISRGFRGLTRIFYPRIARISRIWRGAGTPRGENAEAGNRVSRERRQECLCPQIRNDDNEVKEKMFSGRKFAS